MEQYIVSARKYRPSTFHSVIGQSSLTATLKSAIKTNHLAHAYLFCGPRGVGKTTCARIFAKTINCFHLLETGEACNECESCRTFNEQRSMDIFELDAASNNSVEDIKNLIDQVRIAPQIGKYSVYIIDEVHMLSAAAFNAFLKTLEEPPSYAIFILATTEKHKVLPTIISRCQVYDFNRIYVDDTVKYLKYVAENEKITAEEEALNIIAQKADGAMRDALSIFDQVTVFCGNNITYRAVIENLNVLDYEYYFRLVNNFLNGNITDSLLIFNEILNKGFDAQNFVSGLAAHLRDILVSRDAATLPLLQVSTSVKNQYAEQAAKCAPNFLFKALEIANNCDLNYKTSRNKRLLVELSLIKICQILMGEEKKNEQQPIKKIEPAAKQEVALRTYATAAAQSEQQEAKTPALIKKSEGTFTALISPKIEEVAAENQTVQSQPKIEIAEELNEDFTEAQLQEAWTKLLKVVADNAFFANAVSNAKPKKEENTCHILVLNNQQIEDFNKNRNMIEKFLVSELKNSNIKLKISKDTQIEENAIISPEEKLQSMREKNPDLQEFLYKMNLSIKY
jgi:DNA polymerase-3 subunit gamma/tau